MKAWLITWECVTVEPPDRLAAILSSRKSDEYIADLMELFVQRATYGASEMAYYANRKNKRVYKAQTPLIINNVAHGSRVICGHDPWLYGRIVNDLKIVIDEMKDVEILSWKEPDNFEWEDKQRRHIRVDGEGRNNSLERAIRPISHDIFCDNL